MNADVQIVGVNELKRNVGYWGWWRRLQAPSTGRGFSATADAAADNPQSRGRRRLV